VIVAPDLSATGTVTNVTCSDGTDGSITINNELDPAVAFENSDNDYIDTGESLLTGLSAFTLEGWIKFNKSDISGTRVGSLFGQNDVIEFGIFDSNSITCWTASGGEVTATVSKFPDDGSWHHVAVTGDGTSLILYIDGTAVATGGSSTSNYGGSTSYTAKIGGGVWDPTGGSFTGSIKQVGFWGIALTGDQIGDMVSSAMNYTETETGLIRGYNLNEGTGTTTTAVPSGSGTFKNSPTWVDVYTYSWSGPDGFTAATKNISELAAGDYTLTVSSGSCSGETSFTVDVDDRTAAITCPPDGELACATGIPDINSFYVFFEEGGLLESNCNDTTGLSLEVKDVIVPSTSSASGNCEVERTFTVTDGTTALDSCTQIITLTGTTPPSFRDADGSDYLPAYTSTTPGCVQEIPLPDFEGSCSGVTYSVTQVSGTTVSDLAIDTDAKVLTGTFPAGTYTLEWTIDDVCGYGTATANQLVEVTQPEITYDGFALDELPDGVGSGVKPMSSSTHTYTVDGATASDGYTYRWTITKDSDASVAYATGSGNSETNISVEFTAADYDQGSYTIEVIKSNGSCSVTLERSIEVQINSFDASVTGENSLCQSGETSTATQIKWTVTFPAIDSEPFDFNYTITLNGSTACTGSVSEITYTSSSFDHDSGCAPSGSSATPPFIEIDKSADSYELTVSYTVPNQTATDFDYGIQITASDKYAVSDPEVENDSFSTTAHGVPATSAITTD
jgi:hypothetical protein